MGWPETIVRKDSRDDNGDWRTGQAARVLNSLPFSISSLNYGVRLYRIALTNGPFASLARSLLVGSSGVSRESRFLCQPPLADTLWWFDSGANPACCVGCGRGLGRILHGLAARRRVVLQMPRGRPGNAVSRSLQWLFSSWFLPNREV